MRRPLWSTHGSMRWPRIASLCYALTACVDARDFCADPWVKRRPYASTQGVFALTPSSLPRAFAPTRELWADPYGRLKAFKSAKRLWLVIFMYLVMITLCLYVFNDYSSFRITWKRIWWVMCCICIGTKPTTAIAGSVTTIPLVRFVSTYRYIPWTNS